MNSHSIFGRDAKALPVHSIGNPMLWTFALVDSSGGPAAMQKGAQAIRQAVQLHTGPAEIGKQAALHIAMRKLRFYPKFMFYRVGKSLVVWGDSWASLALHEMDWSGAKVNTNISQSDNQRVFPRWVWPIIDINKQPERHQHYIDRDGEGNFRIQLNLREKDWIEVKKELQAQVVVADY